MQISVSPKMCFIKQRGEIQKTPLKPLFFCRNLVFEAKPQKPVLAPGWWKQNTNCAHCCYRGPKVFFWKAKRWCSETTIFLRVFGGERSWLFTPFFLMLAFSFLMFLLFCSCLTSSCCYFDKQVCVFWLLFHSLIGCCCFLEGCLVFCCFFVLLFVWRAWGSCEVARRA